VNIWFFGWFGIEDYLLARLHMDSQLETYGWWQGESAIDKQDYHQLELDGEISGNHWNGPARSMQVFLLKRIWHWSWTFLVNQNQDLYPLVKTNQKHGNWPPRNLEMTSLLKVLFCADVPGPGQLLSNEMVNKASPVQGPTVRVPRWCFGAQDLHRFTVAWFGVDAGNRWKYTIWI